MSDFDPNAAAKPGSGIFGLPCTFNESSVIVLPVPFGATVSYRAGTADGPAAILAASHQVDLYDYDVGDPWQAGIFMQDISADIRQRSHTTRDLVERVLAYETEEEGHPDAVPLREEVNEECRRVHRWVYDQTHGFHKGGKIVFTLGGDHSVAYGAIRAYIELFPDLGILQIDAHCDLRHAYEGFRFSHASVFRNVLVNTGLKRLVQVGIRDFSRGEFNFIEGSDGRVKTFFWSDLARDLMMGESWHRACNRMVEVLPKYVYVSGDIDGLEPSNCPHTGTPVPGGPSFDQINYLLNMVVKSGRIIIGGDLVEVAPGPEGDDWDANVGARVLYKMIGWALKSQS